MSSSNETWLDLFLRQMNFLSSKTLESHNSFSKKQNKIRVLTERKSAPMIKKKKEIKILQ